MRTTRKGNKLLQHFAEGGGKETNAAIARRFDTTVDTVRKYRRHHEAQKAKPPAPKPEQPPAPEVKGEDFEKALPAPAPKPEPEDAPPPPGPAGKPRPKYRDVELRF